MLSFKHYDNKCRLGEDFLHSSTDIKKIVKQSLELADTLTEPYSLNEYSEVYSSFLIYIRVLHRILSNKENFSQEQLKVGYFYALQYRLVIPRLYVSMIIACLLDDTSYLKSVCSMFPSVSHPLRGLMLRFTAITFFPHDSDILVPFTVTNFNEMMYLIYGFLDLYPDQMTTASEWIASNISISLTIVSDSILINHYIDEAISCDIDELGAASINSVVLSIPKDSFEQYMPKLATFFQKAAVNETNIKSVIEIIESVKDIHAVYEFVKSIHYEEQCAVNLAAVCLSEKDYETLSKLEQTDDVLMLILTEAGPEVFVNLAKPFERGNPLVKEFARLIRPGISPEKVRYILQNEIKDMDTELYDIIADVIQFYSFPKDFIETFFAAPFVFQTSDFLIYIIMHGLEIGVERDILISYIRVSQTISATCRASAMCAVLSGTELVFYILGLENETARKILISKIDRSYPENIIGKILERCKSKEELVLLFHASTQFEDKAITGNVLESLMNKDLEIETNENLFNFYIVTVLNNIITASETELPIKTELLQSILEHILTSLKTVSQFPFPITTKEKQSVWVKIIDYGIKLEPLSQFVEIFNEIKSILDVII